MTHRPYALTRQLFARLERATPGTDEWYALLEQLETSHQWANWADEFDPDELGLDPEEEYDA